MATQSVSDKTKCIITGLLISSVAKCTVRQLCNDFVNTVGYGIPFRGLGFSSEEEYLQSIPDTVRIIGTGVNAQVMAVVKPKSAHVNALVAKQKKTIPNHKRRHFGSRQQQSPCYQASPRPLFHQFQPPPRSYHQPAEISPKPSQRNSISPVYVDPDYDNSESDEGNQITREILDLKTQPISLEEEGYKSKVPNEVQNNLRKLIALHPKGLWCSKLPEEYRKVYGKRLHYQKYHYLRLIDMCSNLPEIFHYIQSSSEDFMLFDKTKPMPDIECAPTRTPMKNKMIVADDFENAMPKLDWKDNSYLIPSDIVNLSERIPRFFIQDEVEGDYLDITLGEVYDASKFWIYIRTGPLPNLMADLQIFFQCERNKYAVPESLLSEGLYGIALYYGEYHRCVIVNVLPHVSGQVKVLFIDYGTVTAVSTKEFWYLPKQFATVPCQAIRARLANIYPPIENSPWSVEATNKFRKLIDNKFFMANITRIDRVDKVLEIYLADVTDSTNIFYVNDVLVSEGYAVYIDQPRRKGLVDKNCVPNVQHMHLYPEFVEIEAGFTPTAFEMNSIFQDSISIDIYYPHYFNRTFCEDVGAIESKEKEWMRSDCLPKYVKVGKVKEKFNFFIFPENLLNDLIDVVKNLFPDDPALSELSQKTDIKSRKTSEEKNNQSHQCQYRKIFNSKLKKCDFSLNNTANSLSDSSESFNNSKKCVTPLTRKLKEISLQTNSSNQSIDWVKQELLETNALSSINSESDFGSFKEKSNQSTTGINSCSLNWNESPFSSSKPLTLKVESVECSKTASKFNLHAKEFVPENHVNENCSQKSTNPFLSDLPIEITNLKPNNPFLNDIKREIETKKRCELFGNLKDVNEVDSPNIFKRNNSPVLLVGPPESSVVSGVRTPPGFGRQVQESYASRPPVSSRVNNFEFSNPYYQRFNNPQIFQFNQLIPWCVDPALISFYSQLQAAKNLGRTVQRMQAPQNSNQYRRESHYGPRQNYL